MDISAELKYFVDKAIKYDDVKYIEKNIKSIPVTYHQTMFYSCLKNDSFYILNFLLKLELFSPLPQKYKDDLFSQAILGRRGNLRILKSMLSQGANLVIYKKQGLYFIRGCNVTKKFLPTLKFLLDNYPSQNKLEKEIYNVCNTGKVKFCKLLFN